MIIDKNGSFCNQRKQPSMAKIQPELTLLDDGQVQLSLNAPDMSKLILPQPPEDAQTRLVKYIGGRIVSMGFTSFAWPRNYALLTTLETVAVNCAIVAFFLCRKNVR